MDELQRLRADTIALLTLIETAEPGLISWRARLSDRINAIADFAGINGTAGRPVRLIPPEILQAIAEVYAEGADKYGEFNLEKQIPVRSLLNHAIRHIFSFLDGSPFGEPDLEYALWRVCAAIVSVRRWPALNRGLRTMQTIQRPAGAVGALGSGEPAETMLFQRWCWGQANDEDIDDAVGAWHRGECASGATLASHLGMTEREYKLWAENRIISARLPAGTEPDRG